MLVDEFMESQKTASISVVVPNYNLAPFLERTLTSVLSQGDMMQEIILVDGASTDGSMEMIEPFRDKLAHLISEPDRGHADALNKGFAKSTGDIMGWINSDDILLPGCLKSVSEIFNQFPEINWIVGNTTHIDEQDRLLRSFAPRPHSRRRFLMGDFRWVQQESVFWRRSLWEKAGARIEDNLRLAVDLELWVRFFRHAPLHRVNVGLGAYRMRADQRSQIHAKDYMAEARSVLTKECEGVSNEYKELLGNISSEPFRIRTMVEADALGEAIAGEDKQVIFLERNTNAWINPNHDSADSAGIVEVAGPKEIAQPVRQQNVKRLARVEAAAIQLAATLRGGRMEDYQSTIDKLFSELVTDLLKKKLFGDQPPLHHEFLAPSEMTPFLEFLVRCLSANRSNAQLFQDLFALWALEGKREGFFVEVGVGNGERLSNTFVLERDYNWNGVLCEANPDFEASIRQERAAKLETRCVSGNTGDEVEFLCAVDPEFSRAATASFDIHDKRSSRITERIIKKQTVSLVDLLDDHDAPVCVDFLSLDIEGLEMEVLSAFPFADRFFRVAVIEHNYGAMEAEITNLMIRNGYKRLFAEFSRFDAWFVHESVAPRLLC